VVFNLDTSVSNDDLRLIFGAYGEVKEVRVRGFYLIIYYLLLGVILVYKHLSLSLSLRLLFHFIENTDKRNPTQAAP
jgi:RNA recognition motif-containing protein